MSSDFPPSTHFSSKQKAKPPLGSPKTHQPYGKTRGIPQSQALPACIKEDLSTQHTDSVAGMAGGHLHDVTLGHDVPGTAAACEGSCCLAL